jgi:hypothetical protein
VYHIKPNPYLYWIANKSFYFNLSLWEYSGIKSKLEQVLELGNIYESVVCLSIINFNEERPPTGVLSLPVVKKRNAFLCSWLNSFNTYQKFKIIEVSGLNPPLYLAPFLSSFISIMFDPQIIFSSSSAEKS